MVHLSATFVVALSLFNGLSQAVDISFSSNFDCSTVTLVCSNIPQGQCCDDSGLFNAAALFTDTPATPLFFAAVYPGGGCDEASCGAVTGPEQNLCLTCDEDTEFLPGSANWFLGGNRRREPSETEPCRKPDKAVIEGRRFNINYDVPEHVTRQLSSLAKNLTKYADMPSDLLKYETA